MTQHLMKKGIKKFGDTGTEAVLKELKQLHNQNVLEPAEEISRQHKREALQYLLFLKKKGNRVIKRQGCANGQKQRPYTSKDDSSAPTVAIKSVMLLSAIDAKEFQGLATVDIPGAFMIWRTLYT